MASRRRRGGGGRVDVDGVTVEVGQEGVVAPVGPQPLLGGVGEPVRRTTSACHTAATAAVV